MSESAYMDDFFEHFISEIEFIQFLNERENKGEWFSYETNELVFHPLEESSSMFKTVEAFFDSLGKKPIISDTIRHTALIAEINGNLIPIRTTAIKTILERACISGNALKKVSKGILARILTDCVAVQKGKSLIRMSEDKISAVHSGDDSYSILPIPELIYAIGEWLEVNYPNCYQFKEGTYEHSMTTGLWEIVGDDELVCTYISLLDGNSIPHGEIRPALKFTSSDTAASGANLYPMLYTERSGKLCSISLGNPIKLIHKKASIEEFKDNLTQVYGQYSLAIGKLEELLKIHIRHPANCLGYVMKELKLQKKMCMEIIERFKLTQGTTPCTAHDVYFALNEVVYELQASGGSGYRVAMMEENIARALNFRWKDFDIAGDFKW